MASAEPSLTPAQHLAGLLDEQQMLRRCLGKRLAAERGIAESTARSLIYKWLRGSHVPDEENARALGRIFGVPAASFRSSSSDDEDGVDLILEQFEEIRQATATRDEKMEKLAAQMGNVLTEMAEQLRRQQEVLTQMAEQGRRQSDETQTFLKEMGDQIHRQSDLLEELARRDAEDPEAGEQPDREPPN